jgi:glutathione S-transferase
MLVRWSRNMPRRATTWPQLGPDAARLCALPSFIELHRREALTGWDFAAT